MGKGNIMTHGAYEGLFYIDNDDFHVYQRDDFFAEEPESRPLRDLSYADLTSGEWVQNYEGTGCELEDIEECFASDFTDMFPSFERVAKNQWIDSARVLLESKLFYIAIEDNEWSMAVKLLQKEEPWGMVWMENLQKRLYQKYLEGIKRCLLMRLPSIGIRTGAWTSGIIKKEEVFPLADARK